VKRAHDGRKATKARGVPFARKPRLTQHQQADGRRQLEHGEFARSIARDFQLLPCHRCAAARGLSPSIPSILTIACLLTRGRPNPHDQCPFP
jgi:hypothetical protein